MDHSPANSSEYYKEFVKGIWKENPVFVQVLGMCPMLAVTNSAINGLAMGVWRRRSC
jgi:electron transport complex protein RnfE